MFYCLTLGFISASCDITAAIVVSDMIDKLSPNIDPLITVAIPIAIGKAPWLLKPTAIGAIVAIVPIEVPIAVEIKAATKNNPINKNSVGIKVSERLTVASILPIDLVTSLKAPAKRKPAAKKPAAKKAPAKKTVAKKAPAKRRTRKTAAK